MPTLTRLLCIISLFLGLVYGCMVALVAFVKPTQTIISIEIPLSQLNLRDRPENFHQKN
ncbi:hypothetical protein [Bartonella tamiae]|uniref:Uncharacterized protein n=1 Tax=Bartonella tamiae Th239 TaxID=1094558 RepID=J1K1S0_9HYPH|nr:hypothetical protein [Bartonella tamiae]EJF91010.1 hypothetical protein ME5_00342 [Bartonella tamiae Th239]EJF93325.1 hypothetical protein MEG_01539 [Bartonella tamiae Th307]